MSLRRVPRAERRQHLSWCLFILHRTRRKTSAEWDHMQAAICVYSIRIIILDCAILGKRSDKDCDFKAAACTDLRRWSTCVLNCISLLFCWWWLLYFLGLYFWGHPSCFTDSTAGSLGLMYFTLCKRTLTLLFRVFFLNWSLLFIHPLFQPLYFLPALQWHRLLSGKRVLRSPEHPGTLNERKPFASLGHIMLIQQLCVRAKLNWFSVQPAMQNALYETTRVTELPQGNTPHKP